MAPLTMALLTTAPLTVAPLTMAPLTMALLTKDGANVSLMFEALFAAVAAKK